ncbi:MAG: hypothetical protein EOP04_04610 [Proteobacteria bacterium]|nr:MAG: hypothetical protein EOP04_04610 [Pseudomonadota bacterium]
MPRKLFDANVVISEFDKFLLSQGLTFTAVAIGGSALSILGIIDRPTQDVDLLTSHIPSAIANASLAFADLHGLNSDWLNLGPLELLKHLPADWTTHTVPLFNGKALTLRTLNRQLFINVKLWAMCDRSRDLEDLIALAPTPDELKRAVTWVTPLDANPEWPKYVLSQSQQITESLAKKKELER